MGFSTTPAIVPVFVGTNGITDGHKGLVPGPLVADSGKFLRADGTWATASTSLAPAVIILPTSSTRNVIQPSADFIPLVTKRFNAGATSDLLEAQDENAAVLMSINSSGGVTAPTGYIGVTGAPLATELTVITTSASDPRGILSGQYSTDTLGSRVHLRKARGTPAVPTTIVTGDTLGRVRFSGYDGSSFLQMGSIDVVSTGTVASTRIPTYMAFQVATNAAPSVLTEVMRLTATSISIPTFTTNGFIKTSGGNGAFSIDTSTYITGNQTITLSGVVTGSGATAITTAFASSTGSNAVVLATSPTITTPVIATITGATSVKTTDTETIAVTNTFTADHASSGTPSTNFGTGLLIAGQDSTTGSVGMGRLRSFYTTATHASYVANTVLSTFDFNGEHDILTLVPSGAANVVGQAGFNTGNPQAAVDIVGKDVLSTSFGLKVKSTSAELITATADRDFSSDTGHWTGTGWAISGGTFNHTVGSTADGVLANSAMTASQIVSGNMYKVVFTLSAMTAGTVTPKVGTTAGTAVGKATTYTQYISASGNNVTFSFTPTTDFDGKVDNVSITRLADTFTVTNNGTATLGSGNVTAAATFHIMPASGAANIRLSAIAVSGSGYLELTKPATNGQPNFINAASDANDDTQTALTINTFLAGGSSPLSATKQIFGITNGTLQRFLMLGTGASTLTASDSATAAVTNTLTLDHSTSGTPAASYGTGVAFQGQSSTTASRNMGRVRTSWIVATDASRASKLTISAFDTAERDAIFAGASGSAPMVSFLSVTTPIIQITTGVAAASFVANTSAIANDTATWGGYTAGQIVQALKNYGLLA